MKAWVLAGSANGYTCRWKLYTGKEGTQRDWGLANRVVLDLVDAVVTDNFYSSPSLIRELRRRGFGAFGNACRNRKGLPPAIRDAAPRRGEVVSSVDVSILTLKWKDNHAHHAQHLYKVATQSKITQLDFRLSVAKSLTEGLDRPHHCHHPPAPQLPLCLTERAFPEPRAISPLPMDIKHSPVSPASVK